MDRSSAAIIECIRDWFNAIHDEQAITFYSSKSMAANIFGVKTWHLYVEFSQHSYLCSLMQGECKVIKSKIDVDWTLVRRCHTTISHCENLSLNFPYQRIFQIQSLSPYCNTIESICMNCKDDLMDEWVETPNGGFQRKISCENNCLQRERKRLTKETRRACTWLLSRLMPRDLTYYIGRILCLLHRVDATWAHLD